MELEIYVKNGRISDLLDLLGKEVGDFIFDSVIDEGHAMYTLDDMKLLLNKNIQDGYLSVWLKGTDHWKSDLEMAHIFSNKLKTHVRCDPGPNYPDISPYSNVFVEVYRGNEKLVEWG